MSELKTLVAVCDELASFERQLSAAEPHDDTAFRELLERGIALLGLAPRGIAERFDTSQATVTRWRQGTHTPYPAVRRVIYTALRKLAIQHRQSREARITELRAREASGAPPPVHVAAMAALRGDDGDRVRG